MILPYQQQWLLILVRMVPVSYFLVARVILVTVLLITMKFHAVLNETSAVKEEEEDNNYLVPWVWYLVPVITNSLLLN